MKKIFGIITIAVSVIIVVGVLVYAKHQATEFRNREDLLNESMMDMISEYESEKKNLLEQIDDLLTKEVVVFDATIIKEQILEIGELASESYIYREMGVMDSKKQFELVGWDKPFTDKKIVMSMDGVLKVGIDVTEVKIVTDENTKTITAYIPKAKVLSNELDEHSLIVYVEEEQIFNKITLQDSSSVRIDIKENAEKRAVDQGILVKAQNRAGELVRNLIIAVPSVKDTYKIIIKT